MREVHERDIGDVGFKVEQLPGIQGRRVLVRLYKLFGPSIGALIGSSDIGSPGQTVTMDDIDLSSVGNAITRLALDIREEDLDYLCKTFGDHTQVRMPGFEEGQWLPLKKIGHDNIWHGRYKTMFLWLAFALEVNYADFFGGLGGASALLDSLKERHAKRKEQSTSPSTSTGKSGESSPPNTSTPA